MFRNEPLVSLSRLTQYKPKQIPVNARTLECEFWPFRVGVAEDPVLLGYDAASVGDRIPTFRGNVVSSSPESVSPREEIRESLPFTILLTPHDNTSLLIAYGTTLPSIIHNRLCAIQYIILEM
jgi:hypothetical protein